MVWTWPDYTRPMEFQADAVVVGSGAGGAPVAFELAEAGLQVVLVEEGSYWTSSHFTQEPSRMAQRLYRNAGAGVMLGRPYVAYVEGRCVGGSTVINGGVCWRTPESVLEDWSRRLGLTQISAPSLEPFFKRVEEITSVGPQDAASLGAANERFRQGAERLGWKLAVSLRNQIHCMGTNACILGCPTGAKQSTLVSYVPRSLERGAHLLANVCVERVLVDGKGKAVGVEGRVTSHLGEKLHRITVRAPVVVVATGASGTPILLRRSGLKNPWIGRNLHIHPNVKAVGLYPEEVRSWVGVTQAYQVHEFLAEGINMAMAGVPPGLLAMSLPGLGEEVAEWMASYPYMIPAGVLVEDSSRGSVTASQGGEAKLRYQTTGRDLERFKRGVALLSELHFAAGARGVLLPFRQLPAIRTADEIARISDPAIRKEDTEVFTVHLMGTCRMGSSPGQGAVDSFGRSWEVSGLFVADASLLPTPIAVNPQETVMALATRTATHILEQGNRGRFSESGCLVKPRA